MWHWLLTVTGVYIPNGVYSEWYNFWSGIGGELAILGGLFTVYRHHKCTNCLRIARHPVEGTPYRTCHKHTTVAYHSKIHRDHSDKYPLQHQLLNKKGK